MQKTPCASPIINFGKKKKRNTNLQDRIQETQTHTEKTKTQSDESTYTVKEG